MHLLGVLVLLALTRTADSRATDEKLPYVKCERTYRKIGCFDQSQSPAQRYLINDRDPNSEYFQGHVLSWEEFEESIHRFDFLLFYICRQICVGRMSMW